MACSGCSTGDKSSKGCRSNGGCSTGGCNKKNVFDWLSDIPVAATKPINKIHEISFKNGSRKAFFRNDKNLPLYTGDLVAVSTGNVGFDVGQISLSGELVELQMKKKRMDKKQDEFGYILRKATNDDLAAQEKSRALEQKTMVHSRVIARNLGLDMKVGDVEYQADGKKATFYYTAEGRVDFRELIKDLAREFKVKIEMRQIGSRQEAGRIGGIGSCGRELCCSTWLTDFSTVTTGAARYQNLSINQTKLSGQCGRLKCCLNYELDTYLDAIKSFPKKADYLYTKKGKAKLMKTDLLKGVMFYAYQDEFKFYQLTKENVHEIIKMNKAKQQPESLRDFSIIEEKEDTIGFVDTVGQIDLKTLEKNDKKRKNKQRRKRNQANKKKNNSNSTANQNNPVAKKAGEQKPTNKTSNKKRRPFKKKRPNNNSNQPKPDSKSE